MIVMFIRVCVHDDFCSAGACGVFNVSYSLISGECPVHPL